MIHQYNPQRFRILNGRHVGTVPVGTIVYLLCDREGPRYLANPWQVIAWHNRKHFPCTKDRPGTLYISGGHLATVRNLRDGRTRLVADHYLLAAVDAGLERTS